MFEITPEEREYLIELLKAAHTELLHELHHTDTRSFEAMLKNRIQLNEALTRKLSAVAT